MRVNKRIRLLVVCILFVSFLLAGCDPPLRYIGENVNLMATALYSIPGLDSHRDDRLIIMDTDQYGRTLFAALLTGSWMVRESYEECILGVFVTQGSNESASYFYSERNYILSFLDAKTPLTEALVNEYYSEDAINALKQQNDWGVAPEDTSIVPVAVPITVEKNQWMEKEAEKAIEAKVGENIRKEFFRFDNTGKALYFVFNIGGKHAYYEWYLAMLDESGNLIDSEDAIIRLDDIKMEDIPNAIADYLQKNNWVHITEPQ